MVWMSLGPKIFWGMLVFFLLPFRSTSAAGVVLQKHSVLLERKHLKYNCLSLPARKSGWRILDDSALDSARTAGQPVHVDSMWHLSAGHMYTHPSLPLCHQCMDHFFLLWSLSEYPVLWHALVMWAPHYGVDQCFCHAHHTTAAIQILWFAT